MQELSRPVSWSSVQQIQVVMPQHYNARGRLFGGQLMAWIDVVGGIVAIRHSGMECTTASVDYLSFEKPINAGEIILLKGCVTHVGNSSMEVRVDTFIEHPGREYEMANRAYITYVALDHAGKPARVPRLELSTPEERVEWEKGVLRAAQRKERRQHHL